MVVIKINAKPIEAKFTGMAAALLSAINSGECIRAKALEFAEVDEAKADIVKETPEVKQAPEVKDAIKTAKETDNKYDSPKTDDKLTILSKDNELNATEDGNNEKHVKTKK